MTRQGLTFNPPPGWPKPPAGWVPPKGWTPDPNWPSAPSGWQLWICDVAPPTEPSITIAPVITPLPATVGLGARMALLEAENAALRALLEASACDPMRAADLNDERVLQDVGIYRYHHPLENAVAYRDRLAQLTVQIAEVVKSGGAIEKSNMFTFDFSLAKVEA